MRHSQQERSEPSAQSGERLQKVLAAAGIGSRRECEQLITDGRVEVDKVVVTQLGTRVDPARQHVRVDGVALTRPKQAYYVVNKPTGMLSTNRDPEGRPRVIDLIATDERLFCVGRLDKSSEGLMLLTNDGNLANQLTHPRFGVEKTYRASVVGFPTAEHLAQLRKGVHLAEGFARVASVKVRGRHKRGAELEIVLNEGRNREIRRVLARVGHKVLRLKRIAIGPIKIGNLPVGAHRRLTPDEVGLLRSSVARGARRQPRRPNRSHATQKKRTAKGRR